MAGSVESFRPNAPEPVLTGLSAHDLVSARSITLIIHGVGYATADRLLAAAGKGYALSGLGGTSERVTLSECPTLSRKKGAEALVLKTPGGEHFLVALPWADRRIRLSAIAKWSAVALLVFAAVATASFVVRGPLESVTAWLRTWPHRLMAYGVIVALSFLVFLLNPNATKQEFKPPSMSLLVLPPLLLLGLMFFVDAILSCIPIALLVVSLWLMSTVMVARCFRIASTLAWRFALAALIVGMALPGVALLRIAWKSAAHSAQAEFRESYDFHIPDEYLASLERESLSTRPAQRGSHPDPMGGRSAPPSAGARTAEDNARDARREAELEDSVNKHASDPLLGGSDPLPRELDKPGKTLPSDLSPADMKLSDLITTSDFLRILALFAICMGLCSVVLGFHWLLDFGFDVLHYTGREKHRASLIKAAASAIRWFHEQTPKAPIIVVGHSLGSVIASQAIASLPTSEACLQQIVLVTLGSPLNYLNRVFPVAVHAARELSRAICPQVRWINLWRENDPIGKALNLEADNTVQYCVGAGSHPDYWSDGAVWRAVAREALGMSGDSQRVNPRALEACVFERHLGAVVLSAVALLTVCGAALWLLTV